MAMKCAVISNLEGDEIPIKVFRRYSFLDECPIVSATPEDIKEIIRDLLDNPKIREKIGFSGRSYVEKYHSYKASQYMFNKIYEDNKLDDIDLEDKKCEPQDSIQECQTKLTDAMALFDEFKKKMVNAYKSQSANEDKFTQLGKDVDNFRKDFDKWMGQLDQLGEDPIDKLGTLKETIQDYDVNQELLGDEKDLKSNMVKEIEILIKAITEFKQYEDELKEAKSKAEQAQVELDALKREQTAQEVEKAAKEEEQEEPETGTDVEQGKKDKDGDGNGQPTEESDDGGSSSEVEPIMQRSPSLQSEEGSSEETAGTGSPSQKITSEIPEEEHVATDEEVARKRHEEIEKLKETQLPAGLKRSQSEVQSEVIPPGEEGGIKRADSSPGKIGSSTKDVPSTKDESIVEREVKKKEQIIAEQERQEEGSSIVSPQKGKPREEVTMVDEKGDPKEIGVGGRKKKSRRRKKSKKRKSKKNRR